MQVHPRFHGNQSFYFLYIVYDVPLVNVHMQVSMPYVSINFLFSLRSNNSFVLLQLLQNYKVHYIPGWDCHGLPIELKGKY